MLEIVYGESSQSPQAKALLGALSNISLNGVLYLGYPVLSTADSNVEVDGLLLADECGLVAFDLTSEPSSSPQAESLDALKDYQSNMYAALFNKLNSYSPLRSGRQLRVQINVVSCNPTVANLVHEGDLILCRPNDLPTVLAQFLAIDATLKLPLNAAIQRVSTLRPSKRRDNVKTEGSRGAKLKDIEKNIANLDKWQNQGAIEFVDGPQRIRGLAGSGKTVVLALKAAYLHSRHPEWRIAVTFQSRSLYQQFRDLIRRFAFEQTENEPNWENLQILHGWGSSSEMGLYSKMCGSYGLMPLSWGSAEAKYGSKAFDGICTELLAEIKKKGEQPLFDAVLVDEGQDFPSSFYKCIFAVLTQQKRIIWAYDDLQNLGDYEMPSEGELFGFDNEGHALVKLENVEGRPREDIVLPVCYRNTHWALATAHALGFGIYRSAGLVQMFEDPKTWLRIGYELKQGSLGLGQPVAFQRRGDSYPDYFPRLLKSDDAVMWQAFENSEDQYKFAAAEISKNLQQDELEATDILIILPDAWSSKKVALRMMRALAEVNLKAHHAGVTTSRDKIFIEGSIAITHIYRAKGNEAPMVYVVDADFCNGTLVASRKRNVLFTAITRSRCWVRIFGVGAQMKELGQEIEATKKHTFALDFKYPNEEQTKTLSLVHKDMTDEESENLQTRFAAAKN